MEIPELKFYKLGEFEDSLLKRVVIVSRYEGKWIYCKAKDKDTWELPGGKIEENETPLEAAKRELFEETGANKVEIKPICLYTIFSPALLCYATVFEFKDLPEFEIEEIGFFDKEPKNLTYPETHPLFFSKVVEELES